MIAVLMPYYLTQHVRVALGTKVATYFLGRKKTPVPWEYLDCGPDNKITHKHGGCILR